MTEKSSSNGAINLHKYTLYNLFNLFMLNYLLIFPRVSQNFTLRTCDATGLLATS